MNANLWFRSLFESERETGGVNYFQTDERLRDVSFAVRFDHFLTRMQ